ncbi:MAG: hypothetical protein Q8940_07290 [Bacteroidota bacterium]|nr:hypothetical protein [Bacteroidota bacterium]
MEDSINYANYKKRCLKYGYDPKNIISLEVLSRSSLVKSYNEMYHKRKKKKREEKEND